MILRVWTTGVHPDRRGELADFARKVSLPMFRRHDGLLAVLFAGSGSSWVTVTAWRDAAAVAALEASADYREVVDGILASGLLTGDQRTEAYELVGGEATALAGLLAGGTDDR